MLLKRAMDDPWHMTGILTWILRWKEQGGSNCLQYEEVLGSDWRPRVMWQCLQGGLYTCSGGLNNLRASKIACLYFVYTQITIPVYGDWLMYIFVIINKK